MCFQLAGEGSGHFDIGEMAFDATFDHDYGEHEVSKGLSYCYALDGILALLRP